METRPLIYIKWDYVIHKKQNVQRGKDLREHLLELLHFTEAERSDPERSPGLMEITDG